MVATSSSATLIHRHSTTGRDIDQHPTRKWSIVDVEQEDVDIDFDIDIVNDNDVDIDIDIDDHLQGCGK